MTFEEMKMNKIIEKLEKYSGEKNTINEIRDDDNPEFLFNGVNTSILLPVALGKIDAKKLAQKEMAQRGFGKKGEWIGFDKAEKLWKVK